MSRTTTNRNSMTLTRRTRATVATAMALVVAAGLLGACVSNGQNGYGMKQGAGTLLGAGLGGLAGSKFGGGKGQLAMVAAGTLLGGFLGNEIGASLDRADQAYLSRAQGAGLRHVLGITGKGSSPSSEGVLRRAVPGWLSTPPFAGLVSGYSAASRQHGGDGALYVRLRRGGGRAA